MSVPSPEVERIGGELVAAVRRLAREVRVFHDRVYVPLQGDERTRFPETLFGYMMCVFARIDLASAFWEYPTGTGGQTGRMVRFMDRYFGRPHDANAVAVQMWRHKPMHTGEPRRLVEPSTGLPCKWLVQWGDELPRELHFAVTDDRGMKVLNLGLLYLVDDLCEAVERFVADARTDSAAEARMRQVEHGLNITPLRPVP